MRNTCPHQTLCSFLFFFTLYLFFPFSASVHAVGRKGGKASVDSASKGKALVDEGEKLMKRGETAKSLLVLNRYIDDVGMRGATIADSALFAKALMLNAHNYVNIGNSRQALTLMRQALPIVKASGDRRRLSELYNNIFSIYYSRHEYDQAEDLLQAALQLSIADADSAAIRNLYNNFGLMYYERGKYASAIGFMDKALAYSPKTDRLGRSLISPIVPRCSCVRTGWLRLKSRLLLPSPCRKACRLMRVPCRLRSTWHTLRRGSASAARLPFCNTIYIK